MAGRVLSPRASRTLYNVADAVVPPGPGGGAGDVDLAPAVERILRGRGPGAARRTWLALAALEWWPVLTLRARRGFSRASLEQRRDLLGAWHRSRLRRGAVEALEALVREAFECHLSSGPQVSNRSSQSIDGA